MSAVESEPVAPVERRSAPVAAVAALLGLPLVAGAALGAVGGWLWWQWWAPPPPGRIYDTAGGPVWYPTPFDPGITRDFDGTATYVVVGFVLAAVLGVAVAWFARDRAVPGLLVALLGAGVGAGVMLVVGLSASPPDPTTLVAAGEVGDALPGHLEVTGWSPYLAWPVGVLAGYVVVMLSLASRWERPAQPSAAPGPPG